MKFNFLSICSFTVGALAVLSFASKASADNFVFVDDGNKIFSYPVSGSSPTTFSNNAATSDDGITASVQGVLYAAISNGNASGIYSYSPFGVASLYAAAKDPTGIAINSSGDIFVGATVGTNTVLEEFFPGNLSNPTVLTTGAIVDSLAVDSNGDLFEADDSGIVYEYQNGMTGLGGRVALNDASVIPGDNLFGIIVDNSGNIYVAYQSDTSANGLGGGIDEITPSGTVTPFVTYTATSVPTDISPEGLAYDPSNNSIYESWSNFGVKPTATAGVFQFANESPSNPGSFATGLTASPDGLTLVTPEPGSIALLAMGLLSVFFTHRRRKVRQ